jgi:hypothetical protein
MAVVETEKSAYLSYPQEISVLSKRVGIGLSVACGRLRS